MKHHFGDMLERSGGHWSIVPNIDRYKFHFTDLSQAPKDCSILTITKSDQNFELLQNFSRLEELTLHEPSKDQIHRLPQLKYLRRLRITHARPKSLDFLKQFESLEELVLEYVSGVESLSPIAYLPNLKALHLENLRRVQDFSDLSGARELKYLSIDGTLDWKQPVDNLDFLSKLHGLEYFRLWYVRVRAMTPVLLPLFQLTRIKRLFINEMVLPLEDYAWIEAMLRDVKGTTFSPYDVFPAKTRKFGANDLQGRVTLEELEKHFPEVRVNDEGERYEYVPEYTFFLGLNGGTSVGCTPKIVQRRLEYTERYKQLVNVYRDSTNRARSR